MISKHGEKVSGGKCVFYRTRHWVDDPSNPPSWKIPKACSSWKANKIVKTHPEKLLLSPWNQPPIKSELKHSLAMLGEN